MSSTVGRNSLIMASGTAASRVTGQIRTILLAAAIGTTGLAANAYQAGSMIPQSVFTLVSGGIFNAVLVPQIVRTLKEKDAEDRLNRLITLAIGILLAVTVVMCAATPLLARLYVGSNDPQMIALTSAFTLWCMPQIFFYGLYTVIGQILAAKDHFASYAWSSTGANIISCAGFTAFIVLFGKANEQPLSFWTADKITLTAGTWTLGVAFQALILFLPLFRLGFRYRPKFGLTGFGLKAMGPVALGSLGVVIVTEISGIVLTRIATLAPQRAHELSGASLYAIAGNATYQNAFTLYILPYSLIAVSVSTAMFPKISRSIAAHDFHEARHDLGSALSNVGLLVLFFAAALVVYPEPIIRTLLPSVSMNETMLISYALIPLSCGIPAISALLLIQRTFYAFEDGLHPFITTVLQYGFMTVLMIAGMFILPPDQWVVGIACSVSAGSLLALPPTLIMLRKRFSGDLDGRPIVLAYGKALAAAVGAGLICWLLKRPVASLLGASIQQTDGKMSWLSALGMCVVLTVVLAAVYLAILWALRTEQLTTAISSISARLGLPITGKSSEEQHESTDIMPQADGIQASPTARMSTIPNDDHMEPDKQMKPQLGDTILNRYTLVSSLREEPGIEAWQVNDRVLAKDCQLFIVTNRRVVDNISTIAGEIAAARPNRYVPVLKYRMQDDVLIAITPLDSGLSLDSYCSGSTGDTLSYAAMRSILGETVQAIRPMLSSKTNDVILTADTVRVTSAGVEIADAPLTPMLLDASGTDPQEDDGTERHAVRQLAALLYALLTRTLDQTEPQFDLNQLPEDVPGEFRVICKRGLVLSDDDEEVTPMASLAELDALLGDWKPLTELSDDDIALPTSDGECSIVKAPLQPADDDDIAKIPESLINNQQLPTLSIDEAEPIQSDEAEKPDNAQRDSHGIFDFTFPRTWESENISGEDTDDWYSQFAPAPVGDSKLTMPIPTSSDVPAPTAAETTSRIPVFDASGREIQPGEESQRALEEEQAQIAKAASVPPSFIPKDKPTDDGDNDELADESLFGSLTTKVVAIIVAAVVVVAAAFWAMHALQNSATDPADSSDTSNTSDSNWPDVNMDEVPFGEDGSSTSSDASNKDAGDAAKNTSSDDATKKEAGKSDTAKKKTKIKKVTADKSSNAVPQPRHENNTAFTVSSANFLSNPAGQSGYGYHIHLDQPHDVYRMVITIRSSGGKGYIRANTGEDPTQGEQVAEFTFADGGTTEVKFNKVINTQDLMLWVPIDSLPQNQLYIEKTEVF